MPPKAMSRLLRNGSLVPPLPKFVAQWDWLGTNFGSERGTSKFMIPVPLFDLKFLNVLAASGVGTSNRRHWQKPNGTFYWRCGNESTSSIEYHRNQPASEWLPPHPKKPLSRSRRCPPLKPRSARTPRDPRPPMP